MEFRPSSSRSCSIIGTITPTRCVRLTTITAKAFSPANFWFVAIKLRLNYGPRYRYTRSQRCAGVRVPRLASVHRCTGPPYTYERLLVENDYVVNEREAGWRDLSRARTPREWAERFVLLAVLLFHFNGAVGSAGTLMPGRVSSRARARRRPKDRWGDNL